MFNICSIVIGILGSLLSAISLALFLKEKKKNKTIYWRDIPIAMNYLSEKMKKDFIPEIILIPNEKGGVLANFLKKSLPYNAVCIFGIGMPKKRANIDDTYYVSNDFINFSTAKWDAYLPKCLFEYRDKKLLILDDFTMTGDFLEKLKDTLTNTVGFNDDNIRSMCLATTIFAKENNKEPDYYWKIFETPKVFLPWGKPE